MKRFFLSGIERSYRSNGAPAICNAGDRVFLAKKDRTVAAPRCSRDITGDIADGLDGVGREVDLLQLSILDERKIATVRRPNRGAGELVGSRDFLSGLCSDQPDPYGAIVGCWLCDKRESLPIRGNVSRIETGCQCRFKAHRGGIRRLGRTHVHAERNCDRESRDESSSDKQSPPRLALDYDRRGRCGSTRKQLLIQKQTHVSDVL